MRLRWSLLRWGRSNFRPSRPYSAGAATEGVRVRFAPSPTGELHLGGYRTALFNYLFARRHGGKMALRIEDTDRARRVPGAEERLEEMLGWGGITIDEGPAAGGPHGPYRQSERLELYREAAGRLLESGRAYRCFCTERRLDLLRREAARRRAPNRYDGRCAGLSREEAEERAAAGEPHVVRFRLTPGPPEPFRDLVFGETVHDSHALEGDPVVVKSDGFPTYHLASVVDDHHMRVTHVLRGREWAVSTPKHVMLYRALGWEPPRFAHLPLMMNADGTKLSKRQGDVDLSHFRDRGYHPESVLNYVTLVGGGFEDRRAKNESEGDAVLTMDELADRFSLDLVSTHSGQMEPDRLGALNRAVLKSKLGETKGREELAAALRRQLRMHGLEEGVSGDGHLLRLVEWAQDRIYSVADLAGPEFSYLWTVPDRLELPEGLPPGVLADLGGVVGGLPEAPSAKEASDRLRTFCKARGVKFPTLMKFLRLALTGSDKGPPVGEVVEVFGRDVVADRVRNAVAVVARGESASAG